MPSPSAKLQDHQRSTWISAPILQNSTCEVLRDPCKLLCESSSLLALIPCSRFAPVKLEKDFEEVKECVQQTSNSDTENVPEFLDDDDMCMSVIEGNLLDEIMSSVSSLEFETKSSEESLLDEPIEVIQEEVKEIEQTNVENWNSDGDDSFKDVIEAINRLCDTMSSSGSEDHCTQSTPNTYRNDSGEERCQFNSLPNDPSVNFDDYFTKSNGDYYNSAFTCNSQEIIFFDNNRTVQDDDSIELIEELDERVILANDNNLPSLDNSSNDQNNLLQRDTNVSVDSPEDALPESHSPNLEEIPAPGHVAAMRMRFETITCVSTMRLLKRADE